MDPRDGSISVSHSMNHQNLQNGKSARFDSKAQPEDAQSKISTATKDENRVPLSLPVALNGMLKTTIETGDIGQFAIKPSRNASFRKPIGTGSNYIPQRPQQRLQTQDGQQEVDDRRLLPSYSRDGTSEIGYLSETASQKAYNRSRIYETSGSRSYSMTQTSQRPNALPNYRSSISLRSHPERGFVPRPRSPFVYPARLKRHGFPPSSPVPREEGKTDIWNNTELEATPYTTGANARSASPLNPYHKRLPFPLIAQPDSNNTYPSQLRQTATRSRPYSPSLKPAANFIQNGGFRPELGYTKAYTGDKFRSPATTNHNHRRSPNSFVTSTNKSHIPSPLYYDYAEDFEFEERASSEDSPSREGATSGESAVGDAPSISSNPIRTTQKSRENNFEGSSQNHPRPSDSSTGIDLRAQEVTISNIDNEGSSDSKPGPDSEDDEIEKSTNVTQDIIPLYFDRQPSDRIVAVSPRTKGFSPSSLGADDGLGLESYTNSGSHPFLPDAIDRSSHQLSSSQSIEEKDSHNQENGTDRTSTSSGTLSFRFSTGLPVFPEPPKQIAQTATGKSAKTPDNERVGFKPRPEECDFQGPDERLLPGQTETIPQFQSGDLPTFSIQRSATTHERGIRSSRYFSIDHGLTDLAQMISTFEFANESLLSQDVYTEPLGANRAPPSQASPTPPISPSRRDTLLLPNKLPSQSSPTHELRPIITKFRSDSDLRGSRSRFLMPSNFAFHENFILGSNGKGSKESVPYNSDANRSAENWPPFRFEDPMLAPKAVSPARVLRLKNSVPHLMKALPPVPQDALLGSSSRQQSLPIHATPTAPLIIQEHREEDMEPTLFGAPPFQSNYSQQDLENVSDLEQIPPPAQKFRIRPRFFDTQRSHNPTDSQRLNLDENYSWEAQQPVTQLPSLHSIVPVTHRGPKFKLRVTRSSISPSNTVRINPGAKSSLDLRSPKDLFTSSSNISGMFRQVSQQFSSRKSSAIFSRDPGNDTQIPSMVLASTQVKKSHERNPDLLGPASSVTVGYPTRPAEERSFFSEDSSQIRGQNSLRKRISNFRARIPSHYTSRSAAHSSDYEARRRHAIPRVPATDRPTPDVNSEQEDEYGMPLASLRHRTQLKSKVTRWFKDAGLAMRRGVKLHISPEVQRVPYR